MTYKFSIPTTAGETIQLEAGAGEFIFLLGANGTGKSSLVTKLGAQHPESVKRISAHRQTWFESDTLNITPRDRAGLDRQFRSQDLNENARWMEWNAAARANTVIFDLIDADTMAERKIAALVRGGDLDGAAKQAGEPSPIQVINEIMRLSNLPIEISVQEGQRVVARKNGGEPYSVAELSDGERNAFLIGANVLTAKPGSLILIDEPERHLHRSIASPLLRQLLEKRNDCTFVVSTHESSLPLDMPSALVALVRGCDYQNKRPIAWTLDVLPPGGAIDESLKLDILGARRRIIFVEGGKQSLDFPLYTLLFPDVSVIPKESCRDVENAVRGLRSVAEAHWVRAWGIVDQDQRPADEIDRLRKAGVWALAHYSVEALYYHPVIVRMVGTRQGKLIGGDHHQMVDSALAEAVQATTLNKDGLVLDAVVRSARRAVQSNLPTQESLKDGSPVKVEIDVKALLAKEEALFDSLVSDRDWDGLLTRYPLRKSPAFDRIATGLRFPDKSTYLDAVLKLLQDESTAITFLRKLLGDLYGEVTG